MWIRYKYVCNIVDGKEILLEKRITYSAENLIIAETEAYNGEYTIEEDSEPLKLEPLEIELGGTGANNPEGARRNLGLEVLSSYVEYYASNATGSTGGTLEYHRQGDVLYLVGAFDVTMFLNEETYYSDKTFYVERSGGANGQKAYFNIREKVMKPLTCSINFTDGTSSKLYVYGEFNTDGSIKICEMPPKDVYGQIIESAIVYIEITYMNHAVG